MSRRVIPIAHVDALRQKGLTFPQIAEAIGRVKGARFEPRSLQKALLLARRRASEKKTAPEGVGGA